MNAVITRSEGVDRLIFRENYKGANIKSGDVLSVVEYDTKKNLIITKNERGQDVIVDPHKHEKFTVARFEHRHYSVGDKIEARHIIEHAKILSRPIQGEEKIKNGARGVIEEINEHGNPVFGNDFYPFSD